MRSTQSNPGGGREQQANCGRLGPEQRWSGAGRANLSNQGVVSCNESGKHTQARGLEPSTRQPSHSEGELSLPKHPFRFHSCRDDPDDKTQMVPMPG